MISARPSIANPGWFGDIGFEGLYYHYREDFNNNFIMSDSGPMLGLYFALGYQPECTAFRLHVDGHIDASKSIHYESNATGSMDNESYVIAELRLLGTYSWDLQNQMKIEGYTGLAGRSLINDDYGRTTTTGATGWLRTSRYSYIPIGLRLVNDFEDMQLISHLEYDWFIRGRQTSYNSGAFIPNYQHQGYGARMGVDLLIPSSYGCFDYNVGAFLRYWNIDDSTYFYNSHEPPNRTYEIGLKLGLSF